MQKSTVLVIFVIGVCCLLSILGYRKWSQRQIATPSPNATAREKISLPEITDTSFVTLTDSPTEPPVPTSTPWMTVFEGYFYCREEPSTSSPAIGVIRGQRVTIIGQSDNWLYVSVQFIGKPCWVLKSVIPNLNLTALQFIPFYTANITPTFTLPPGTQPASTHKNGDEGENTNPPINTPQPTDAPSPVDTQRPADTPRPTDPPPADTPRPTDPPKPTPCLNPQGHPIPCH
jgi:hypothetical protein